MLTPEELEKEEDIKGRIVGMARENIESAKSKGPLEQVLAKANNGFVMAVFAEDNAAMTAAQMDVEAAAKAVGRMEPPTTEVRQIEREISAINSTISVSMLRELKKSVSMGLNIVGIAKNILEETIKEANCSSVGLKLAVAEVTWLLQVAQEAAKNGNAKSAEYVQSINEKVAELQVYARYLAAWEAASSAHESSQERWHSLTSQDKAHVAGLWRAAAQAAHEAGVPYGERKANDYAGQWK